MQSTDNELPTEQTGYYLDLLWHIEDVTSRYKCSDEEALEILDTVFAHELTNSDIFEQISYEAACRNLVEKEEEDW